MITWLRNNCIILVVMFSVVLVVGLTFSSCEAQAQTIVEFKLLPPGHDGQVLEVGRVRYYLLKEYLQLNIFDKELLKLRQDVQELEAIVEVFSLQLHKKGKIITTLEKDKDILDKRVLRLDGELDKCEEKIVNFSGRSIWPYIVGAAGAVLGVIGGVSYLTCCN